MNKPKKEKGLPARAGFTRLVDFDDVAKPRTKSASSKFTTGFTLIELLVVIGLIGVVAAIAFVSLSSAREKTRRSSNLATMASMMPEIIVCGNEGGFGYTEGVPVPGVTYICQDSPTGNMQKGEHIAVWPPLIAGWEYQAPTGALSTVDYVYTATKAGSDQSDIVCTYATSRCI